MNLSRMYPKDVYTFTNLEVRFRELEANLHGKLVKQSVKEYASKKSNHMGVQHSILNQGSVTPFSKSFLKGQD
jgi:hypothetical protein